MPFPLHCLYRPAVWTVAFALCLAAPVRAEEIPVVAPEEAGLSAEGLAEARAFMERQVADQKIAGGVVVVARGGRIGFFEAFGRQDIEAEQPMQLDTIFRLYSMSKAITTAAALRLCDEGRLSLDDPLGKYLPAFEDQQVATADGLRPPSRPVNVRDLMLHTAGFTYGQGPAASREAFVRLQPLQSATLAEFADKLAQVPLAFDPGTQWSYSVSIDLLGRVIEVASGQGLDAYLHEALFAPLDMRDTAFRVPADQLARFAGNYARSADGLKPIDPPATSPYAGEVTFFSGGGGLVGTARDFLRFLLMIRNGGELDGQRILQPETVELMTTNQLPAEAFPIGFGPEVRHGTGFTLGFSVRTEITEWDPAGHVGEYGWGGAASTHYWVSPQDDLIVVTLEQIMPYQWDTEFGLKPLLYDAVER